MATGPSPSLFGLVADKRPLGITYDKTCGTQARLGKFTGRLSSIEMHAVDAALRTVLALD